MVLKKENRKTTNYITAINHYMSQANFNLAKLMLNVSIFLLFQFYSNIELYYLLKTAPFCTFWYALDRFIAGE